MAMSIFKLPQRLRYEIISHYTNYHELSWKFARFRDASKTLYIASEKGNVDVVSKCINLKLSKNVYSEALRHAIYYGHPECVKLLIPVSEPFANDSDALRFAAEFGQTECVKLLIPVSNPYAKGCYALRTAARYGHSECVKLLIPVSDPTACCSGALINAIDNDNKECVKLLIPVSEPEVVKKYNGFGCIIM